MKIQTRIVIDAAPDTVWNILLNTTNYAEWNPFIKDFKGQIAVGSQVQVHIHPPQGKAMIFKPIIQACEPDKELKWKGKLFFKGLFDGTHAFKLTQLSSGQTLFEHTEEFSGLLVRFFDFKKTENGFHLMNQALKKRAEKLEASISSKYVQIS